MGMSRPVHVLQRTATVEEIVNVAAIAVWMRRKTTPTRIRMCMSQSSRNWWEKTEGGSRFRGSSSMFRGSKPSLNLEP